MSISNFIATDQNSLKGDLFQKLLFDEVDQALNQLSKREAEVIRLRYGLIDEKKKTFREISKIYNLSPETIRQIENRALSKLRNIYSDCKLDRNHLKSCSMKKSGVHT